MSYRDELDAAVQRAENAEREVQKMREAQGKKMQPINKQNWQFPKLKPDTKKTIMYSIVAVISVTLTIYVLIKGTKILDDQAIKEQKTRHDAIPIVTDMGRSWAKGMGYKLLGISCNIDRNCALHVEGFAAPIELHCAQETCWLK